MPGAGTMVLGMWAVDGVRNGLDVCVIEPYSNYIDRPTVSFDFDSEFRSVGYAVRRGTVHIDTLDIRQIDTYHREEP